MADKFTNRKKFEVKLGEKKESNDKANFSFDFLKNIDSKYYKWGIAIILVLLVIFVWKPSFNFGNVLSSIQDTKKEYDQKRIDYVESNIKSFKEILYPENKYKLYESKWLEQLDNPMGRISYELGTNFEWQDYRDVKPPADYKASEIESEILTKIGDSANTYVKAFKENSSLQKFYDALSLKSTNVILEVSVGKYKVQKFNDFELLMDKDNTLLGLGLTSTDPKVLETLEKYRYSTFMFFDTLSQYMLDLHINHNIIIQKMFDRKPNGRFFITKNLTAENLSESDAKKMAIEITRVNMYGVESLFGYNRKVQLPNGEYTTIEAPNTKEYNDKYVEVTK